MKRRRSYPSIKTGSGPFAGFRFPPDVILLAVRWYLRGLPPVRLTVVVVVMLVSAIRAADGSGPQLS